jgi:hypothetical protein
MRDIMMPARIFTAERHASKRASDFNLDTSPNANADSALVKRVEPPICPTTISQQLNYGNITPADVDGFKFNRNRRT